MGYIKHNNKKCKLENCDGLLYANKLCRYHYGIEISKKAEKKPRKPIKKKSDKQVLIDKTIAKIKVKLLIKHNFTCQGCGRMFKNPSFLDLSHIIRRSARPDLQTNIKNCTILCRDCHQKYDSGIIEQQITLDDFDITLEVIETLDELYFNRIMEKLTKYNDGNNS